MAEGVGPHRRHGEAVLRPRPRQVEQGPDGRRPLALLAERREVPEAEQRLAGRVHRVEVERPGPGQHVAAGQRVDQLGTVGHAVGVAPPGRREARVEALGRLPHRAHPDVGRQDAVEPPQQPVVVHGALREVEVDDLAAGVDAGVGAAGAHDARVGDAEHRGERRLESSLDGAQRRLGRPAPEVGPVVGQVDPQPHGRPSYGRPVVNRTVDKPRRSAYVRGQPIS